MEALKLEAEIRSSYSSGKYKKCVELINDAPECVRNLSCLKLLKASCFTNTGMFRLAHLILDDLIKQEPNNGLAYYGKGLAFIRAGMKGRSLKFFKKAVKLCSSEEIKNAEVIKIKVEKFMSQEVLRKVIAKSRYRASCDICGKELISSFSLKRHKFIHTGERPYKCFCRVAFIQKSDLLRHMATHSEEKSFECSQCRRRFKTKKNLQSHSVVHSKSSRFGGRFLVKPFMHRTQMHFHDNTQYVCSLCEKTYVTRSGLKKHQQKNNHLNSVETSRKTNDKEEESQTGECFEIQAESTWKHPETNAKRILDLNQMTADDGEPMDTSDQSKNFEDFAYDPEDESDLSFCLSLLRYTAKMNDQERLEFRSRILEVLRDLTQ